MSKTSDRRRRQQRRLEEQRRSARALAFAVIGVIALVAVAAAVLVGGGGSDPEKTAKSRSERSGTATALGVDADAKVVALGHVPLNTTVTPSWRLVNNGTSQVTIGEAHAEVIEGCCPGPLLLGKSSLAPGEATELAFPLQMHAGMDGPHEFSVHIPLKRGSDEGLLELTTTGHFSS
jgi:hypothetical protein